MCNTLPNSTRLNNLYSKEREVKTRAVGRNDRPSLSSHQGKLSDPHGRNLKTAGLRSPQTGLGSDLPPPPAPRLPAPDPDPVDHLPKQNTPEEFVVTSRRPYSPTGLAIYHLQQGSNKGGAEEYGIIVLNYLSTKLGRFTRHE